MSKNVWTVGAFLWLLACSEDGTVARGGKEESLTPEQKRLQAQSCIVQRLPHPEGALEWEISGYVLVDAYVKCQKQFDNAAAADFRTVIQGLAHHVEGDHSRVRVTVPSRELP
jgi:hypothetical protein